MVLVVVSIRLTAMILRIYAKLGELTLNDAAISFEPESSAALDSDSDADFWLLHGNCTRTIRAGINRHCDHRAGTYDIILSATTRRVMVENPAQMPPPGNIAEIKEPLDKAQIITPTDYIGAIMKLASTDVAHPEYSSICHRHGSISAPLSCHRRGDFGFYDKLKSVTRGYASSITTT